MIESETGKQTAQADGDLPQTAVPPDDAVFVFPMSFAQQRMWFLDEFRPGSPFYNIPTAIRLTGSLNVDALRLALNEIVARHEALRTTFGRVNGEPVQIIAPSLTLNAPLIDLSGLSTEEAEAEGMRLAQAEARQPFSLAKGPLLRVKLIRLAVNEHIALVTMHHIVSDGWSMNVFVGELSVLYAAYSEGRPSSLLPLPIQYADYADWQREWLQGEVLQGEIGYWREKLGNPPPVLELPGDRTRPVVQTANGSTLHTKLPRSLGDLINDLSRREGATLFMTLLAAFYMLLYRYTGHTDICVGTPIANRRQAELEPLIGLFINTLVLRTELNGSMTFRELLRRVKEVSLEGYAHQDLPFEMIVDALQPERDMSHSTLFQVMFILQNAGMKVKESPGLVLRTLEVDAGTSTFDLTLNMTEQSDGLATSIEYNTDIFDRSTMQRLLGHFQTLLQAAALQPDTQIGRLPMLAEVERRQALVEWNSTEVDVDIERCIHHLIESQAAATPGAIAVIVPSIEGKGGRDTISYRELDRRANQLAHALRRFAVGPESIVAISAEKSIEMIFGLLGILKAGAAYLPIDPSYPAERIHHMLCDSGARVLITQSHLLAQLPLEDTRETRCEIEHTLCLDADWAEIAAEPDTAPSVEVSSDNLAYVIYTSGSTGQSKGVMVDHRNIVNAYLAWEDAYALRMPIKSHLQMASFSFDVFTGDFVRALCSGGALVLVPRELLLQPDELYALMRRERVTCAEFVPGVLRPLIQHLEDTRQKLDFMQVIACGSDSWYIGEYNRFLRFCSLDSRQESPPTRLINSFGLTETTIDTSYFELTSGVRTSGTMSQLSGDQIVPIGRPFPKQRMYILDSYGEPLPVGVPGELYIAGAGVSRGYLGRPNLTAERFMPDPFTGEGRMYRTGDLARSLRDGNVQFLGRADNQVKIRGYRIEPGEIEAALDRHASVAGSAVTAPVDPKGQRRLVAYFVLRKGTVTEISPTGSDLRRFLQEHLPDYMVPSLFVQLDRLPLTPNGKVDRKALPQPDWSLRAAEDTYTAPRSPTESQLAAIWSEVLGVEQVGVFDNFFELGGHSLLATQLVSRLRSELKVELPLRNIFESPTVAGLAEQIDSAGLRTGESARLTPPVRPVPRGQRDDGATRAPLSYAQQRLWFLDQLEPDSPFYNIPEAIRLRGDLDVAALRLALNAVIGRHEALRTSFTSAGGVPEQIIASRLGVELPLEDLSGVPVGEREPAVLRAATEEAQRPFDLTSSPLFRARLIRLAPDDYAFLLTTHHIISDNWSSGILIREIAALYDVAARSDKVDKRSIPAQAESLAGVLPPLAIQYPDFAHWQRGWLQGEVLDEQIRYWRQKLGDAPPLLELPTDRPRPPMQSFKGAYHSFSLSKEVSDSLRALCQREAVTPFMVLLAAFQVLLSRYSGQDDIVVGSPIANRTQQELEGVLGFFVNTLVLRTDLSGDPSFRELLRRSRETTLGAYAHQDTPFEMLVDALNPQRNLSHSPLFQVMFVLQNMPPLRLQAGRNGGLTISAIEAHSGTSKFDLTLFMVEAGPEQQFSGAVEYNTDLFDEATITRLIEHFGVLLRGIASDPGLPLSKLPIMGETELHYLLNEWNATDAEFPAGLTAHQLIESQSTTHPSALAICALEIEGAGSTLTYAELNTRANQLGHRLRALGVRTDSLVAISMARGLELPVAMLAVLKAGAAYVPLDPTYPPERLAFMLEDCGARVLLTQKRLLERLHFGHGAQVVVALDADWDDISTEPTGNLENTATPMSLAYAIYTSGSTGRPKGTLIHHQGLVNYLTWCRRAYPLGQGIGAPVHSSISFDLTVTSLLAPLTAGRAVYLLPEGLAVELLTDTLRRRGDFSLVKITPAHLQLIGQQLTPAEAVGRTHAFIIGGENLLADHIAFWHTQAPETRLVNEYGPTETVVGCCVYETPAGAIIQGSIPIGRPIINTKLYVLDPTLRPVPIGVPGELYIGGAGVARGYHGRPELTAERFLPDPFTSTQSRRQGGRMYRTGDSVKMRADGNLEYLGRLDEQVKIRGFRVELGEIEGVLTEHPAIQETAVITRVDDDDQRFDSTEKRLIAFVAFRVGQFTTAQELRAYLGKRLPEYMVPNAFVVLDALPLTPNGKVDRRGLSHHQGKVLDLSQSSETPFIPPTTPTEEILAGIWSDLLRVERVGAGDNYFDLGGHSLLATQLVSRIRDGFGVELPLRTLFDSPTLAGLAAAVDSVATKSRQVGAPKLAPVARSGSPLPLSFGQQRFWFLDKLEPDNPFYNVASAVRLRGPLDIGALRFSFNEIVKRHEVLRTTFTEMNGKPLPVIHAESGPGGLGLDLPLTDLSSLEADDRDKELRRLAALEASEPFSLATGLLLRAHLLRLADDDHVLLLTMHHIISDAWSNTVLIREVGAYYAACLAERPAALPPLPIQYADYAVWQRSWLQGDVLQAEIDHWRGELRGLPSLLELPTDRPRPAVQNYHGANMAFELPPGVSDALRALSRSEGTTHFMSLLAAFQTLLHRYTGQMDIPVGVPIANRTRGETEGLIGFFINTLVMRGRLHDNPSFRQLLARVKETALNAYAHQDLPFETLVDALQPERSLSFSPLFQVLFTLQSRAPDNSQGRADDGGLRIEALDLESATSPYDLTLSMADSPDGFRGLFEYNVDLFDATTVRRMIGHFQELLAAAVTQPDTPIGYLPVLTPTEQAQLAAWNNTANDLPDLPIHALFEQWAARTPDATAAIFVPQTPLATGQPSTPDPLRLSYAELNARANQLAHWLIAHGAGPETLIGIALPRSLDMLVALLATHKAGAAYLPLDPAFPQDRLQFMLADSAARLVLTQSALADAQPWLQPRPGATLCLDRDWPQVAALSQDNPPAAPSANQLAYVIYTSGSTGRPKGVLVGHAGLTNLVLAQTRAFGISPADRILQFASFSFDACVSETAMALTTGATLVLAPQDTLAAVDELKRLLQSQAISTVTLPPSLLGVLDPHGLESLLCLISAGERLSADVAAIWAPGRRLFNAYGPTEASIGPTLGQITQLPAGAASAPVGRPIHNVAIHLRDRYGNLTPAGVPGELCVAGVALARGYLGRPDLTADKFVPNPFIAQSALSPGSARLYRTGDLARYWPDGQIEILGRIDQQVKLRGFRIELGEIEALLRQHPAVSDAVALVRQDTPGDPRLVAYLLPATNTDPGATSASPVDWRAFLRSRLPEYMLPSAFLLLDTFPKTPNGKVDRRALPKPETTRTDAGEYVQPVTLTERRLAKIWEELLHVERISGADNFFDLGGHSLLATQLISRLRDAFEIEVPLRRLFEVPTLTGLAASVDEEVAHRTDGLRPASENVRSVRLSPAPRLLREDGGSVLPLSFAQQRLWFLDRLEPGSALYNLPTAMRFEGTLNIDALQQALTGIVRRHEVLRTTFHTVDGEPVQFIDRPEAADDISRLELTDLSSLPEEERNKETHHIVEIAAQAPFDLTKGPLLRTRVIKVQPDDHVILLSMHHIVSDGWSMGILVRELTELYTAAADDAPSRLRPLPVQYADYGFWQRSWLEGRDPAELLSASPASAAPLPGSPLQQQLDYWKAELDDLPALLELPTDRPRPSIQTYNGATESFGLPAVLTGQITALGHQEGATPFMTLLAAFHALLHRYSGQDNIAVGMPIANRTRGETEDLIGFFVNTLVMRGRCGGNPTFRQLLSTVKETALGAYAHQDLPFETLVDALRPTRDMSHSPIFQVVFTMQNLPLKAMDLPGLRLRPVLAETGIAKYDLTLSMMLENTGLMGSFEYNVDLFDATTVRRMIGHFQELLSAAVTQPDTPIGYLPVLTPTEQAQLAAWNNTANDLPDLPIHALFEQWAARTPDATAAIFVPQTPLATGQPSTPDPLRLSYAELNARANQLAHWLIAHGAGPETLIGIALPRSLDMLVALLATHKAGAAYLPLDPAFPQDRLQFMLADSAARLVLTQSALADAQPWLQPRPGATLCLDRDWPQVAALSQDNPPAAPSANQLAYVIYTSGSTGRPKGVLVGHAGLTNLVLAQTRAFGISPADRILQFASFSFDACVSETAMALTTGATLVLAPQDTLAAVDELKRLLQSQAISTVTLPPSLLGVLDPHGLESLLCLISAGERLSADVAAIWAPGRRLFNAYGPTEASIGPTLGQITQLPAGAASAPVGRPIHNVAIHLRDRYGNLTPAGVPGELCVAGVALARGYLGRPDLTADKFVPNPFIAQSALSPGSARLYRTGDLARYWPDGQIEILGRIDQQVKLRGFRIELGEIEALLRQHPAVSDAVALVRQDTPGDPRLVAYLLPATNTDPGATSASPVDWRAFLRSRLPEYMLPSAFLLLDTFPKTPNGKVDRRALPKPETTRTELTHGTGYIAPRNPLETRLAAVFEDVLGIRPLGVRDDFFDVGGHSLLAVKLAARVGAELGFSLPLAALFEGPTVEQLATSIREKYLGGFQSSIVPIKPAGTRSALFFIHPSGGSIHWYYDVAKHMPDDRPLYGLQAHGLMGDAELDETVEDMAARYVIEIRQVQPDGPYHVASWSMGVAIALEVAQQLVAQGTEMGMLAVLDQGPVSPDDEPQDDAEYLVSFFGKRMPIPVETLRGMESEERIRYVMEEAKRIGWLFKDVNFAQFKQFVRVLKTHSKAWRDYTPKPYSGTVSLFRAAEREFAPDGPSDLGWTALAGNGVDIVSVPGDHNTMLHDPNVEHFVAALLHRINANENRRATNG